MLSLAILLASRAYTYIVLYIPSNFETIVRVRNGNITIGVIKIYTQFHYLDAIAKPAEIGAIRGAAFRTLVIGEDDDAIKVYRERRRRRRANR